MSTSRTSDADLDVVVGQVLTSKLTGLLREGGREHEVAMVVIRIIVCDGLARFCLVV